MTQSKRPPLLAHFIRLLFIQGLWNYQTLQGNGFLFALIPFLKEIDGDDKVDSDRYSGFFNTHPYLASLALGATLQREVRGTPTRDEILQFHNTLAGPLGLMGDTIFWSGWKPVCALFGVFIGLMLMGASLAPALSAIAFLIAYNIPHFHIRWWGLTAGWELGDHVLKALNKKSIVRLQKMVAIEGAILMGLVIGVTLAASASLSFTTAGVAVVGGAWSWIATKLQLPLQWIVVIPLVVILLLGCIV
jgi:PTS system mannose-specific IID component